MGVRAPATITISVGNIIFLSYSRLEFGAFQGHDGVAAPFARFFYAYLGAIDQVCNNILTLVIRFRDGLDNSRAQRDLRGIPWWPQPRRRAPQLIGQVLRTSQAGVRQNEGQGPRSIFYRDIVLTHDGLQGARELLQKTLHWRFALLPQNFCAAVNLQNGQGKRRALRTGAIRFS